MRANGPAHPWPFHYGQRGELAWADHHHQFRDGGWHLLFPQSGGIGAKDFAFVAYLLGMLLYLGEMLIESTLKVQVLTSLRALTSPSPITRQYLGVNKSWLGYTTVVLFNGSFWLLAIGVFYLLFFWHRLER